MSLDPKKKGHLLMIALGKGPKPAPKDEPDGDEDEDGLDYGADDRDGDEPDDGDGDEEGDEDSIQCAHDLISAIHSGDAQGVVDAIKAIVGG